MNEFMGCPHARLALAGRSGLARFVISVGLVPVRRAAARASLGKSLRAHRFARHPFVTAAQALEDENLPPLQRHLAPAHLAKEVAVFSTPNRAATLTRAAGFGWPRLPRQVGGRASGAESAHPRVGR